jgi:hypothetical protein
LIFAGLAENQCPADLGVIAIDLRAQFGGDAVAFWKRRSVGGVML